MRSLISRLATIAGLGAAVGLAGPALAQLTVTDGGVTTTKCTSYTVSYSSAAATTPTITLSPSNCLSNDPPPPSGPYFRFASNGTTSSGEANAVAAGGAANITYTVELVRNGNADPLNVSVEACRAGTNCTALAGQDYYLEAGFSWSPPYVITLPFASNETSKSFVIAAADDQVVDGSKLLTFSLINPSSVAVVGTPGTQALTLTDNEAAPTTTVKFDATAPAMFENTGGGGLGFIGVSRSSGIGSASVQVVVQTSSTAVLGTNYALDVTQTPFTGTPASYTVNFAEGETQKGIYVRVIDVAGYFGHKTAVFGFSNPVNLILGTDATSTLTIYDKDPPPAGGVEYDKFGQVIPDPSMPPGTRNMCEYAGAAKYPGGGGGPCGGYEIDVGNCGAGMNGQISKAWMFILENYTPTSPRIGNAIYLSLPRDQAMVFRFKTGTTGQFPELATSLFRSFGVGYAEQVATHGPSAPRFVTLSEQKCDFDYAKTVTTGGLTGMGCYKTMTGDDALLGRIWAPGSQPADPAANFPYCPLKPDTVYYLNMRWENADTLSSRGQISCPVGQAPGGLSNCGSVVLFQ